MMSAQHTPGPWAVHQMNLNESMPLFFVCGPSGSSICEIATHSRRTIKANARLIAAAPDLLEACELAIPSGVCLTNRNIPDGFTVSLDCTMGDLRKIAAAIAKARGEAA